MTIAFPHAPRLPADQHQYVFDAAAHPALHVASGDIVRVETLDCFSNRLTADAPLLTDDAAVLAHIGGRYNPVCAPIYITGAEVGDVLAIDILGIAIGARAPMAVTHIDADWAKAFGGDAYARAIEPHALFAATNGQTVLLDFGGRTMMTPARPMIGTIGTAPESGQTSALLYAPGHGGNLDCPHIAVGTTVLLPVNVPGALLSLGDVHALMGDGEITGTALETSADVTIRVHVLNASNPLTTPRLRHTDWIGSIGCASKTDLQTNITAAVRDLAATLVEEHAISLPDGIQLINLFGRITVNQAVVTAQTGWSSVLVTLPRDPCLLPFGSANGKA
ncbi:Amidase [Devosia sp. LC5]|uniref:acetamidase/formamidase family protein n=1 Tax=Devosia sp. LC5 TaxID=1502724 RepID=UPI0004E2F033|nr:acetamidase/formamidase family protein [Devosia sp. LC5]KFC67189.1 Amidase [Devosia sp. LC5]